MAEFKSPLSPKEIENNFSDIAPRFNPIEATLEASRCLFCFDAPCIRACPTKIDIPTFIRQISSGDVKGAAKTIFTENILGGSCGRACPTSVLCEGACVYNDMNKKPIEIGRLQRYASDFAVKQDIQFFEKGKPTGRRVAIVGGGPAGLSCAHALTQLGHECTVYEAEAKLGGLNTYGLAGYKIDTASAVAEAEYVTKIGFKVSLNTKVGQTISFSNLQRDFDAVFLAFGLGETSKLNIPGEETSGVLEALEFIRPTRDPNYSGVRVGRRVLVLGAGNTAIDVATAAKRLGAEEVTIVYRRTNAEMPAFRYEYELAKSDAVQFLWKTSPVRIIEKNGQVTGLEVTTVKLSGQGKRAIPEIIPGSNRVIECDMVVKALGQEPHYALLKQLPGLELQKGVVQVNSETYATSVPGIFAGGDVINGGGEVVDAVQHGKIAARGINAFLCSSSKKTANL